jgi:broad specificity phosphatase PhoE
MQTSPDTIDLTHVRILLEQGHRVALFLRHSERPPISPTDKEFGRTLGLTPHGVELALAAGRRLAGCSRDAARFSASPMNRCRLTARHIAEGMGFSEPVVDDADELGVHGFYYEDAYAVQDAMRRQGYMAYMLEYLRNGNAPHSLPIGPATERMAEWLQRHATTRLGVFVSHDIFIASFLTGLHMRTYAEDDWVGFLHGAALVQASDDAEWVCHACVPDLVEFNQPSHFVH